MSIISRGGLLTLQLIVVGCSGGTNGPPEASRADLARGDDVLNMSLQIEPGQQSDIDEQKAAGEKAVDRPSKSTASAGAEIEEDAEYHAVTENNDKATTPKSSNDPKSVKYRPRWNPEATGDAAPPRSTLVGQWEFILCQFGSDILGMLIEIEVDGGTYKAELVDDSRMMPKWTITSSEITAKHASINFLNHKNVLVNFEGSLQEDGVVRGNVQFGEKLSELVRLMPTRRESLDDAKPKVPSLGVEMMQSFKPDRDNAISQLREQVNDLGDSALAFELARRLSGVFRGKRPPESEYRGFPEQYLAAAEPWGKRITDKAHLDIAFTMALCGYSTEEAAKHLAAVETDLAEDLSLTNHQRMVTARSLIDLQSNDEGRLQQAMQVLEQIRKDNPFETNVALGLATYHERNQQLERALEFYAELAALPTGAGDMKPVEALWQKLGRDPAHLENYLGKVYKEKAYQFIATQSHAPRADGHQQVVLGELFTGTACPPCVAADVATGGLEITFPKSELVILRYHQHIPGLDPFTVEAGQQRGSDYYGIEGTPSLFFNGRPVKVKGMSGAISQAPEGYTALRKLVERLLAQSRDLKIEIKASLSEGMLSLSAAVEETKDFPDAWRLRLVLAEEEIFYKAPNGVRLHEMVVREMPGGSLGIAPDKGHLKYADSISLEELRTKISGEITQIPNMESPPIDLSHLHVVAFVQDDSNRSVLQTAIVPVAEILERNAPPGSAYSEEAEPVDKAKTREEL